MPLVNTKEMFKKAYEKGYAVGSFNVDTLKMAQAVLLASEANHSPVIIAFSEGSRDFMHPGNIRNLILEVSKDITIDFAIHLDHGRSVEACKSCIDEGFTSVMIDASKYSYEENIRQTSEVVKYAHERGVTVEGELGGLDANHQESRFTDPKLVKDYVTRTGVDSLAVSVGTGHGTQKFLETEKPDLRYDILEEIKKELPGFPLVLHGSSSIPKEEVDTFNKYGGKLEHTQGIPEELLRKAVKINVCKINIGTDFRVAYTGALRKSLSLIKDHYEPRNFLLPAYTAAYNVVLYKEENIFLSANKN
jgi:fructose-bisphosphate aldolase class II